MPTELAPGGSGSPYAEGQFDELEPQTDEQKVAFVEQYANQYNYFIHALHRQWYEAVLWYVGEHYLEFNWVSRRFSLRAYPDYVPRTTTNHIYPKVELGMQLFLEAFPDAIVRPSSRDLADRQAAEAATHVRRQLWKQNYMEMKMRELAAWVAVTGNGHMLNFLDNASKERVRVPVYETVREPVTDERGEPVAQEDPETGELVPMVRERRIEMRDPETGEKLYEELVLADANTMVVTPFEIVPDFSARHPWEMRRYVYQRPFPVSYLRSQFGPEATKDLRPEKQLPINMYYPFKILDLLARAEGQRHYGLHGGISGADQVDTIFMRDAAVLKTYFEVPSEERPDGRIYAVANGKLLHEGTYSELYGEKINLHTYRWSILPGSMYAFGVVKNLIDPQKRLNGLDTQRALIRKTMGNPAWMIPKGSGFTESAGTARPGKLYYWKKNPTGRPPERLDPKQAPFDLEVERRNILQDMEKLSGMRDVLEGGNPPGVTAGVALDILTEAAGKRFLPMIKEARDTFRRMEMDRLAIAQRAPAWEVPRLLAVMGEDGEMEARRFTATDFRGEYDVHVEAVTPSMFSITQKKADLIQSINMQLVDITNYRNRDRARQILNVAEFDDAVTPDTKVAMYENSLLLAGKEVVVGPFDDDMIHDAVHDLIFKRTDIDKLPQIVWQNALNHRLIHQERLRQKMEKMAAEQAASGAPEKGKDRGQPSGEGASA